MSVQVTGKCCFATFITILVIIAIILPICVYQLSEELPVEYIYQRSAFSADDYSYLNDYFPPKELSEYFDYFVDVHDELFKMDTIGKSAQKNKILQIGTKTRLNKPIILIVSGILACDWRSILISVHLINRIVEKCVFNQRNPKVGKFIYNFVPLLNPDGYKFTMTSIVREHWMKNYYKPETCNNNTPTGTNIYYNFDTDWAKGENDQFYGGSNAFSELESTALKEYVTKIKDDLAFVFLLVSPMNLAKWDKKYITFPYESGTKFKFLKDVAQKTSFSYASKKDAAELQRGRMDNWIASVLNKNAFVLNIQANYRKFVGEKTKKDLRVLGHEIDAIIERFAEAYIKKYNI